MDSNKRFPDVQVVEYLKFLSRYCQRFPSAMELVKGMGGVSDAVIAGAVSGCLTRAILSPVDVVKIRFQLQLEPIKVGGLP